jgi:hypothetical protein
LNRLCARGRKQRGRQRQRRAPYSDSHTDSFFGRTMVSGRVYKGSVLECPFGKRSEALEICVACHGGCWSNPRTATKQRP